MSHPGGGRWSPGLHPEGLEKAVKLTQCLAVENTVREGVTWCSCYLSGVFAGNKHCETGEYIVFAIL